MPLINVFLNLLHKENYGRIFSQYETDICVSEVGPGKKILFRRHSVGSSIMNISSYHLDLGKIGVVRVLFYSVKGKTKTIFPTDAEIGMLLALHSLTQI